MPSALSRRLPLLAAVVVGVLLIVGLRSCAAGSPEPDSGSFSVPSPPAEPVADPPREDCTTVTVAASSEKAALLTQIAADYRRANREVDGRCYDVRVTTKASGGAEEALARGWNERVDGPRPDVWSPAASTWVGLLRHDLTRNDKPDLLGPDKPASIASTPLVLAMPKPMAQALGWPKAAIGWSDVLTLARNPSGWAAKGHPEWGRFRLGKTNPNLSTSGLAATVGAFVAATGRSSDLTSRDLADPKVQATVAGVESAVVHYGDTTLTYLANLQRADDEGSALGYVSAAAVEEKSVLDYNAGNPSGDPATVGKHAPPKVKLVAVYPKEGTLFSDNPYVVLRAPWVGADVRAGAQDFLGFLREPAAQKRFTDAGFRSFDNKPGDAIRAAPELQVDGVKIRLNPPPPAVLAGVRGAWEQVRKRARVLLLLDVSGSMEEPAGAAGKSKLELAKTAALDALQDFAPTDQVGVWAFTTDLPTPTRITVELAPVAPLGSQRDRVTAAVRDLIPLNGTPLYAATRRAAETMTASADASRINAVVVLTDGRNEYPADTDLAGLKDTLSAGSRESGVRVFTIAYGEGADLDVLREISEASRASAYDATNPANIGRIFTAVVSNF